jgi:hypothetical protein
LTRVVLGYVAQAFLIMFNRSFSTESLTKGFFLRDQAQRKPFKNVGLRPDRKEGNKI